MEMGSLMYTVSRELLMAYSNRKAQDANLVLSNNSYEELERELIVSDWLTTIVKLYNKYIIKSDVEKYMLPTDFLDNKAYNKAFWPNDTLYSNFMFYDNGYGEFYKCIFDAIKEFHDSKVFNCKINIPESKWGYRPIRTKRFDELSMEEVSRDMFLFHLVCEYFNMKYLGYGKIIKNNYYFNTFNMEEDACNAYLKYKNICEVITFEEALNKYKDISLEEATKLGVYIINDYFSEVEIGLNQVESSIAIIPNSIDGKKVTKVLASKIKKMVNTVYILGDLKEINNAFSDVVIEEVRISGKIDSVNKNAFISYNSPAENNVKYIKLNDNPHYYAAEYPFLSSDKVVKIHNETVELCSNFGFFIDLTTLDLGNIKKIHKCAFSSVHELEELIIPDSVEVIEESAFTYFDNLKKIHIGKGLKEIKHHTFSGNDVLESVNFPETLQKIERDAFLSCNSIKNVKVHANTIIEEGAFPETTNIERYGVKNKTYTSTNSTKQKELKTLVLKGNVFKNVYNEDSDYEAIHFIGKNILIQDSFGKMSKVKKVTVDGNIALVDSIFLYESKELFTDINDLEYLYLNINDNPYYICTYGTALNTKLHESCESVCDAVFQSNHIETIDFTNVKFIGESACMFVRVLKKVKFSNNLKIISKDAFYGCGLEEVILPKSLIFIGPTAFDGCEKLKYAKVPKTCKVAKNAFPSTCKVEFY